VQCWASMTSRCCDWCRVASGEHPTIPIPDPSPEFLRTLKETVLRERRAARIEALKRFVLASAFAYTLLGATAGFIALGLEMWRLFK